MKLVPDEMPQARLLPHPQQATRVLLVPALEIAHYGDGPRSGPYIYYIDCPFRGLTAAAPLKEGSPIGLSADGLPLGVQLVGKVIDVGSASRTVPINLRWSRKLSRSRGLYRLAANCRVV